MSDRVTYSFPGADAYRIDVTFVNDTAEKPTTADLDAVLETVAAWRNRREAGAGRAEDGAEGG